MPIDKEKRLVSRFEASKITGLPQRFLKHAVSDKYRFKKPPHKTIGKTTFYGPVNQLLMWFNSNLKAENTQTQSDKSDTKNKSLKAVK